MVGLTASRVIPSLTAIGVLIDARPGALRFLFSVHLCLVRLFYRCSWSLPLFLAFVTFFPCGQQYNATEDQTNSLMFIFKHEYMYTSEYNSTRLKIIAHDTTLVDASRNDVPHIQPHALTDFKVKFQHALTSGCE
jgi:hypothetical protein